MGNAGMTHVAQITSLRRLDLFGSRVTDRGAFRLRLLTNLQSLELCSGGLSDTGVGYICQLPGAPPSTSPPLPLLLDWRLFSASFFHRFSWPDVRAPSQKTMSSDPPIETVQSSLNMNPQRMKRDGHVDKNASEGIRKRARKQSFAVRSHGSQRRHMVPCVFLYGCAYVCAALETLNLAQNPVTDASLAPLLAMRSLRTLSLANTQVTAEGLQVSVQAYTIRRTTSLCNLFAKMSVETRCVSPGELPWTEACG